VSVAQIAADDRLLDALGRGEAPEVDLATDPAAAMLAAWQADLDGDGAWMDTWDDEPETAPLPLPAGDPRRKRRLVQAILGAAAAAVVAVGLGVSAHQAQPGSVLWPVSKVVYPQRAEVKAAEKAIADARAAAADGRPGEALALLTTAEEHIARIDDLATAARLRAEVAELRRTLLAAATPPPATSAPRANVPTPSPAPRASESTPSGSSGSDPSTEPGGGDGDDPEPSPSRSAPGGILPDLPLPTPLLPLPSLPLPPLPPILG